MLITNGKMVQPGLRRRTIHRQVSFGPISLRIVSIIVIAAAALIFLGQSTASATKNYTKVAKEKELTTKQKELEEMQFEATRLESLKEITATDSPTDSAISNTSPNPSVTVSPTQKVTPSQAPSAKLEPAKQINVLPNNDGASLSQAERSTVVQ